MKYADRYNTQLNQHSNGMSKQDKAILTIENQLPITTTATNLRITNKKIEKLKV